MIKAKTSPPATCLRVSCTLSIEPSRGVLRPHYPAAFAAETAAVPAAAPAMLIHIGKMPTTSKEPIMLKHLMLRVPHGHRQLVACLRANRSSCNSNRQAVGTVVLVVFVVCSLLSSLSREKAHSCSSNCCTMLHREQSEYGYGWEAALGKNRLQCLASASEHARMPPVNPP